VAAVIFGGIGAANSQTAVQRETIEWCNLRWENTNDQKLPRVLLIGDSISVGYGAVVKERLKGKANVDALATSKAISDPGWLKETAYAVEGYRHAVIHFNNGLHGVHVTGHDYESSLRAHVKKLRELAPHAKLIWASTTPVPSREKGVALDEKGNARVQARNTIAERVIKEAGIPINDLYGLVVGDIEKLTANKGNVHYNDKGKKLQGQAVADAILKALGQR
jgi:hypothetical protein